MSNTLEWNKGNTETVAYALQELDRARAELGTYSDSLVFECQADSVRAFIQPCHEWARKELEGKNDEGMELGIKAVEFV